MYFSIQSLSGHLWKNVDAAIGIWHFLVDLYAIIYCCMLCLGPISWTIALHVLSTVDEISVINLKNTS